MKLPLFQLDTFTDKPFAGNAAAVCPLPRWIDDSLMQAIAAENNLPETAFFVGARGSYHLRWFTPVTEVDLCGHGTLASGFVVLNELERDRDEVKFQTRCGELAVRRSDDGLAMDLPSQPPRPCAVPPELIQGLGVDPVEVLASEDFLVVLENEDAVRAITPDFNLLRKLPLRGVIVTAPGLVEYDFVSRFFGPKVGVDEDPVTGSAHCVLTPYWAGKLQKSEMIARQVSARGGILRCSLGDGRVALSGKCVKYLAGEIFIE
jgi:PhzF family phenazine biosynthesis protein